MSIKAILFDKDGTLFDFHKTWMPPCWEAAGYVAEGDEDLTLKLMQAGGYDPVSERMGSGSALAAANTVEIVDLWLEQAVTMRPRREELIERLNILFVEEGLKHAAPVTDLPQYMTDLKALGLGLGVATMDSEYGAMASLEAFGFKDHMDYIVGYDSGHGSKPGPGMVHGFIEQLNIKPEEVMVVGDNLHDIDMGRSAGAGLVVGVLTGTSLTEDLSEHADHVLDSIVDIPALLS